MPEEGYFLRPVSRRFVESEITYVGCEITLHLLRPTDKQRHSLGVREAKIDVLLSCRRSSPARCACGSAELGRVLALVALQAVREEWIQGGHRVRAVRMLLLYLVYLAVFTLSAVLNSGRNMPHGYHLTT